MSPTKRYLLYAIQAAAILAGILSGGYWVLHETYEERPFPAGPLCLIAIVVWGLVVTLQHFARQRQTEPLRSLAGSLRAVAQGEFKPLLIDPPDDESSRVLNNYNAMVETVERTLSDLVQQRDQAQAVLASMTEGVVALGPQGQVLLINQTAATFFNVDPRQVNGKTFLDTVRYHELQSLYSEASQSRHAIARELKLTHPEYKVLLVQVVPLGADREPENLSMVMVFQDVTENYEYERLRKEFVANVSHELKSPLTSIRGLTETLLEGALEDEAHNRQFLGMIHQDAIRLGRLIDDLLELSRIESKGVGGAAEVTAAVRPMVEHILKGFQREINTRKIQVKLEIDKKAALKVNPDRLEQVLINLIDNALKYNREGGELAISTKPEGAWMRILIKDSGVGIPEKHLPHVFERFYRVDKARSRSLGGTGLGLSIVKHIVEGYGGKVSVESQAEVGSTFSFTLPVQS